MTEDPLSKDLLIFADYASAFEAHRRLSRVAPLAEACLAVRVGSAPVVPVVSHTREGRGLWEEYSDRFAPGSGALSAEAEVIDLALLHLDDLHVERVSVADIIGSPPQ